MPDFSNGVATPGGASYMAPLLNFQQFAQWPNDYAQGVFNKQQQGLNDQSGQLNQARLEQIQQQIELSKAFAGGLPTDPSTGQIDYRKAAGILAAKGDIGGAVNLLQQQPAPLSPMFGGQPQGQPQPPQGQPASIPAKPLPQPAANSPKGDSGQGTLTSLVTDRLPSQNQTTGQTIMKIAGVMGVDPNAPLTPGQQRRAQGLLQKYASADSAPSGTPAADTGNLPPSANAVSAAPKVSRQPAPIGAGSAQPGPQGQPRSAAPAPTFNDRFAGAPDRPAAPQPQPQAQPQQPQGPITPQEPLPPGFTDPMKAVGALRTEAARYAAMPNGSGSGQAQRLDAWANRIEEGIKPVSVGAQTTLLDPRTRQVVYQGPSAAAISGAAGRTETLESDAAVYRQTGKLPANIGRGVQGNAEAHAIRELAREQEISEGGNPEEWPTRWQKFGAQAAGRRVLENRAAGLELAENEAVTLIPRVRDASARVSRTEYPSINALINAAKKGTGGTDVIKLGIAIESLVPVYARVLKPTGQLAQGDMARAHDILDKAWSDGQINAALDQMGVELGSARTALDKTLGEYGSKGKADKPASSAAPAGGGKPDADVWISLPNRVRIREIKAEGQ